MRNGNSNYEFDPIGNRTHSDEAGTTRTWLANSLNQYTNIYANVPTYELDGNMTFLLSTSGGGAGGEGWHSQWNGENRMTSVTNDTTVVSNTYDSQGRRVRKQVSVGGTIRVHAGTQAAVHGVV